MIDYIIHVFVLIFFMMFNGKVSERACMSKLSVFPCLQFMNSCKSNDKNYNDKITQKFICLHIMLSLCHLFDSKNMNRWLLNLKTLYDVRQDEIVKNTYILRSFSCSLMWRNIFNNKGEFLGHLHAVISL